MSAQKKTLYVKSLGGGIWEFATPRLSWEIHQEFDAALDLARMGELDAAEAEYRRLGAAYPEFIDVHHHLALLLEATGRESEAFQLWQQTVALGRACLPEELLTGQGTLPWLGLDNRPYLRACHGLGLTYLGRDNVQQALELFDHLLALNPNDNQGARALAIDCRFRLGQPEQVLEICDRYLDDLMEHVLYGRPLALCQLGRKEEAREELLVAIDYFPLVAKELAKTRHRRPKDMHPDYISLGGTDQAYLYWFDQGKLWQQTPGALDLVRSCLQEANQD